MLNWILRYEQVIQLLNELGATSVLDVGSGSSGLSWYWPHQVVQTDLRFSQINEASADRAGKVGLIRSTAERLPFADAAFDIVVSLDMMEHLPESLRGDSIRELARVARRAFITGFPVGKSADLVDRWLLTLLQWTPGCSVPEWLQEHRQQKSYPDKTTLLGAIPSGWRISHEVPSGNIFGQTAIVYAESIPHTAPLMRAAERRVRLAGAPSFFHRGPTYRMIWVAVRESPEAVD